LEIPIILHFGLKNVSSDAINLLIYDFHDDCWLVGTDSTGAELQLTKFGDRMRQPSKAHASSTMGPLAAGAEYGGGTVDAGKHYQGPEPSAWRRSLFPVKALLSSFYPCARRHHMVRFRHLRNGHLVAGIACKNLE
jgi:hypothetical protein